MDKPVTIARPPLFVWLCLALTVLGLLGWIFAEHKRVIRTRNEATDKNLLDRLAGAGTKPVVLVIGTSLVQSGLDSTDRICRCVEQSTGTKIVLLKCWLSGGDLERISTYHEALFQTLHPAVVLMESNLLFYRPVRTPLASVVAQHFRDLFTGRSRPYYDPDERAEILPFDRTVVESYRAGLVDTAGLARFRQICAGWQRGGTRIGLVNFPLEQILENKKWHSPDTAAFFSNLRYLRQTGPVYCNDAGMQLDSTYFFDFGHLNRKGNDFFAPWFCGVLSAEVIQASAEIKTTSR